MPSPLFCMPEEKGEPLCRKKPYRLPLRSRPPAMRSAAACCAGTGSTNPAAHSLGALLDHIAQRQQESPDYYDRMPDLSGKDQLAAAGHHHLYAGSAGPGKGCRQTAGPAGQYQHPGAARRACNAVRTARNEAAHATDHTDAAQAAILFNEAMESLEDGYAGTAFRENELARYYREAENYLARSAGARSHPAVRRKKKRLRTSQPARAAKPGPEPRTQSRKRAGSRSSGNRSTHGSPAKAPQHGRPQKRNREEPATGPCSSCCWWCWCWACCCVHWSMGAA